jgi:hypothetical protein
MPRYVFHLVPDSGLEPVAYAFADDNEALEAAKLALRKVLRETTSEGHPIAATLEVLRDNGTVVGIATAEED